MKTLQFQLVIKKNVMKVPIRTLTVLSALALSSSAFASQIINFGTGSGEVNIPGQAFAYTFGTPATYSVNANGLNISGEFTGNYQVFGVGVGGDWTSRSNIGETVSANPGDFLYVKGTTDTPAMQYFALKVVLLGPDEGGSRATSAWHLAPQNGTWSGGTTNVLTPIESPAENENGGFVFGSTVLDQIQIVVQNADNRGNFQLTIDEIGIAAVPEPSFVAGLAGLLVMLLWLRRK